MNISRKNSQNFGVAQMSFVCFTTVANETASCSSGNSRPFFSGHSRNSPATTARRHAQNTTGRHGTPHISMNPAPIVVPVTPMDQNEWAKFMYCPVFSLCNFWTNGVAIASM